mgnify:CR=1 FL=1
MLPSIRLSTIVSWPRNVEGGRSTDAILSHVDLAPTILDASGAAPAGLAPPRTSREVLFCARLHVRKLLDRPLPGGGRTWDRWRRLAALAAAVAQAKSDGPDKRILAPAMAGRLADLIQAGRSGEPAESGLAALARHREIYDMADNGIPANVIAQKLRRPCGEVELILALRGPKEKKPGKFFDRVRTRGLRCRMSSAVMSRIRQ